MSEALRSHLLQFFTRVYSSYGASDLEINLAGENDFTIAVRQLLATRPELGAALGLPEHRCCRWSSSSTRSTTTSRRTRAASS